jgi:hypothetical protein
MGFFKRAEALFPILMVERMRHAGRAPARHVLDHVLEMLQLAIHQTGRTPSTALRGRLLARAAHLSHPVNDLLAKRLPRTLAPRIALGAH